MVPKYIKNITANPGTHHLKYATNNTGFYVVTTREFLKKLKIFL
jgi:hypothetical protein